MNELEMKLIGKDESIKGMTNKMFDLKRNEEIMVSQRQEALKQLQMCNKQKIEEVRIYISLSFYIFIVIYTIENSRSNLTV